MQNEQIFWKYFNIFSLPNIDWLIFQLGLKNLYSDYLKDFMEETHYYCLTEYIGKSYLGIKIRSHLKTSSKQ